MSAELVITPQAITYRTDADTLFYKADMQTRLCMHTTCKTELDRASPGLADPCCTIHLTLNPLCRHGAWIIPLSGTHVVLLSGSAVYRQDRIKMQDGQVLESACSSRSSSMDWKCLQRNIGQHTAKLLQLGLMQWLFILPSRVKGPRAPTWVNLSRFLGSRLRCTSAMSFSRHWDRCACRSGGCAPTILFCSEVYICNTDGGS